MNRKFFSGINPCTNGCVYCFSSWDAEPLCPTFDEVERTNTVMYPICDAELIQQSQEYIKNLLTYAEKLDKTVTLSVSTKCVWTDEELKIIADFNKKGRAIIKLAISLSCGKSLYQIEPYASTYQERLSMIKRIKALNIPTNVLLKPILPFIEFEEYVALIDDFIPLCKDFVIGALYVDENSEFYKEYIEGKYQAVIKYCQWQHRNLLYVTHSRYQDIKDYIEQKGGRCYESDKELVEATLQNTKEKDYE